MSFLSSLFGKKDAAPNRNDAAALEIARIAQPTIGFMNLMAEKGRQLVELDGTLLAPLFASTRCTEGDVPNCDVRQGMHRWHGDATARYPQNLWGSIGSGRLR